MLESLPFILLIGTLLGFLSGMGVGGGSLLILWLTSVMGILPEKARLLNLLFFLPAAAIATLFRRKQKNLPLRKLLPGIGGGCIAAGVFSVFSKYAEPELLDKIFGILFLITGVRELFSKRKKDSTQ